MSEYLAILIFAAAGTGIVLITFGINWMVRPHHPYPAKNVNYECAEEPVGNSWFKFNNRFYIFGLIFVVFDVEAVFLFPWAVAFGQLGLYALIEMIIFILILMFGLYYAWKKGVLKWV
ncbi:NADH:ubiquinone oxidoreductase subunit A [candidate division GN15 bacterium]|uniref:NADH-quinone oxidoreductase subunit A n=1 Tax=candidate division GN15 bacterium TaxID=2072418 RepID=A0A855X1I6_9BACT|nr:MAG: NADH:ubiquinone oxidoreductase subunit A [candidate division GN15 bacterium]